MTEAAALLFGLTLATVGGVLALRAAAAAREAETRQTVRVTFPRGSTPAQVLAFMRSLTGLLPPRWKRAVKRPAVVIESVAGHDGITHYLRLPAGSAGYVLGQLRAALPGVRIEPMAETETRRPSLALELRTANPAHSLRSADPAESAAAVLASLQPLRSGESVVVQWVVSPAPPSPVPEVVTLADAKRGWLPLLTGSAPLPVRVPAELVRSEREKRAEPQSVATVRLGVFTAGPERDRQLLRRLLGAFHLGATPATAFRRRAIPSEMVASRIVGASVPLTRWPCAVNAAELTAFAGVPIGEPLLPGLTLGASPQLPPAADIPSTGRVLGEATFPGAERPVAISERDSLRHLHVVGPTGVGKSTLLLNLITRDLESGAGIVVVDPKGDLIVDVLDRVPPRRAADVILLDPTDADRPAGFNLLAGSDGAPELASDQVVSLFRHLFSAFWGPRTDDILRAALLTLTREPGMTLAEVPLLLTDDGFRRRLVGGLDDYVLEGFWGWYEALSAGERAQAIGPVLNKLRTFLLRKRLRNVIGQSESTFTLDDVLARRRVLLVSLAKGTLGEDAARLLGSAVLAQLWQAVQARTALPVSQRVPVFCFVDEFQDYVGIPTSFADLLAQARGYGFSLTLAHQHLGQLPRELRDAVLANSRSRVVFQAAHADAAILAKELGPDVSPDDLGALGAFEAVAQVASGSRVSPPVTIRTAPAPPPVGEAARIRSLSRRRYGRPAEQVEREVRARAERQPAAAAVKRRRRS